MFFDYLIINFSRYTIFRFLHVCLSHPQPALFELTVKHCLKPMLEILTKVDNKILKNPVVEITKTLCLGSEGRSDLKEIVKTQICDFISANLPFDCERVFLTLSVLNMLNKNIISQLLVFISEQVEKVEAQRGAGRDSKLRSLFDKLKNQNLD